MFAVRLTQATLRALDWLAAKTLSPEDIPVHQRTGRRGEEDAYFYLRRRGYTIIARNFRSPNHRGELDLVGWERDVLCFIELKTRTKRDLRPAEAAVDRDKQRELLLVARDFLRQMPPLCQPGPQPARLSRDGVEWRFDVLAVYYEFENGDRGYSRPAFELFQNAFPVAYNRKFAASN
jgi:putative endonuclease